MTEKDYLLQNIEHYLYNQLSYEDMLHYKQFELIDELGEVLVKKVKPYYIDTAQIIVPKKYKHVRWSNKRKYPEEYDYLVDLIKEAGEDNVKWVNRLFSYRNYLRRYSLKNN